MFLDVDPMLVFVFSLVIYFAKQQLNMILFLFGDFDIFSDICAHFRCDGRNTRVYIGSIQSFSDYCNYYQK